MKSGDRILKVYGAAGKAKQFQINQIRGQRYKKASVFEVEQQDDRPFDGIEALLKGDLKKESEFLPVINHNTKDASILAIDSQKKAKHLVTGSIARPPRQLEFRKIQTQNTVGLGGKLPNRRGIDVMNARQSTAEKPQSRGSCNPGNPYNEPQATRQQEQAQAIAALSGIYQHPQRPRRQLKTPVSSEAAERPYQNSGQQQQEPPAQ